MDEVTVRWPCEHGYHYSHYDQTNVKPYTKCENQRNVTLRQQILARPLVCFDSEGNPLPPDTEPTFDYVWVEVTDE